MSGPASSVETFSSSDQPEQSRFRWLAVCVTGLRWALFAFAAWYLIWPTYRVFPNVEIDTNEGWNAYLADSAMGRRPLYPSPDKLITNNYPPLSFYIVGGVGKLIGDPLLAGRLLSLAAVLGIGVAIAVGIRALGGDRTGAAMGGVMFVMTICHYCDRYVGMDDPQLLAQAIMCAGLAGFLWADARDRSCLGPILLMACAGFVKHNIIAMPVAAFVWLGIRRPREALKCAVVSGVVVVLGFALCYALYGRDFFTNMLIPRVTSWARARSFVTDLHFVDVALAITTVFGFVWWRERGARFSLLFSLIALGTSFMQRAGEWVDVNAVFDLMIAVSFGTGLAFTYASRVSPRRFFSAEVLQFAMLLVLFIRFRPMNHHNADPTFRLVLDRSFTKEVAIREQAMAEGVAELRATPGDVLSSTYACYRADKFTVDRFNATQRMVTGVLQAKTLRYMMRKKQLTEVEIDPRADWDEPVYPDAYSHGQ